MKWNRKEINIFDDDDYVDMTKRFLHSFFAVTGAGEEYEKVKTRRSPILFECGGMKVININGYYIGFPVEDDELRFQFPNELLIFSSPPFLLHIRVWNPPTYCALMDG